MPDEEMLKQDLEHGFIRVPNPIMETLMVTKINATQLKICMFISRRTYGWNKSEGPITLTEFAAACNTSKAYISKQINELIDMRIIRRIRRQGRLYYHMESDLTLWCSSAADLDKLAENQRTGIYKYSKYSLKTNRRNRHPVHNEHKIMPIESAAKETEGYTEIQEKEAEGSYDDMTFNQEVMFENDGLQSYHDMTPELHDCTTRQHGLSSHVLDYEPCLKTNLKTDKDRKKVCRRSYLRHDCSDRKGSYVDMTVRSYVAMTPGLHNHTTINPKQSSITDEFEPLLNTDSKKVKENVLSTYQERIRSDLKLPKDNQEDPLYRVYLMWRDSIFGRKDIDYQDWLAMKKERSRDGP